jgi:hypothetical protein
MKEIFKKDDNEKEEKGPAELVSFLRLVCHHIFQILRDKNIEYL